MTWRPGHACIEQEVRTLRHGETVDLTALYETYSDLLFRTALTYVSHSEDAQDVVHDVFAVYLAKRPTFQDTSHQRAWMLRVTINKCRDLQRRNAVRRYTPLEDAEHIASPEDSETSELLAAVRACRTSCMRWWCSTIWKGFQWKKPHAACASRFPQSKCV